MTDETSGYTPPSADTTPNTLTPQPWEIRHETMAHLREELLSPQEDGAEHPLASQYDLETQQVEAALEGQFGTLFANQNWVRDVANNEYRFGTTIEGMAQSGDVEAIAQKIATGVKALNNIPEIAQKFTESPEWPKNIFRELLVNSVVAQSAASKAGVLENARVTDVILATQENYLRGEWYAVAKEPLFIDRLTPEETHALAYGIYSINQANQSRLHSVGSESRLWKDSAEATQRRITTITSQQGPLYVPNLINASDNIADLYDSVTKSPHIIKGYKSPSHQPRLESRNQTKDSDGVPQLVQQAAALKEEAEAYLQEAEAQTTAAKAALEAAKSKEEEARNYLDLATRLAGKANDLEALEAKMEVRKGLLNGFDNDPMVREKQVQAAKLERPSGEDPGNTRLKEFFESVATLDPESLVDIYDIYPDLREKFITNVLSIQKLMETVNLGVSFDTLRMALGAQLDQLIESIGETKFTEGKRTLDDALEPVEGVDELEDQVRNELAQLREQLGL